MADKVRTDVLLKDFWRVNERFADLFNAVIFQGKEVLKAEELQEMDTDMSGVIRFREHEAITCVGANVVKKMAFGVEFVVLGIDSEQKIHYAMPLRTMLYDGYRVFKKEYREITQSMKKRKKGKWTEEEFLSGDEERRSLASDHNHCDLLFRVCVGWTDVPEGYDRGDAGGDREDFFGL